MTVSRDQFAHYFADPTSLKPLWLYVSGKELPRDAQTAIVAALVGIRMDLHRILALMEKPNDDQ